MDLLRLALTNRHGDDGDMGMNFGNNDMSTGPLSPAGVNFSDPDQASDFLEQLLDDDQLKVVGNRYARYFWCGIIVMIVIAGLVHWMRYAVLKARLQAAAKGREKPARPKNLLLRWFATVTALAREATYLQWTPTNSSWFKIPPLGTILMLLAYLGFILALEFINNDIAGAQFWEARGIRAGWLAVAQLPLIILLVGKNNLITLCTRVSVERLNVLHRWASRIMLLVAIFHFGFQSRAWSKYGVFNLEWTTDDCVPTGLAAFVLLLWINLSTLATFRHWAYEFFVIQHIITWFGFVVAIMLHLPTTALWSRIYVYIPIGLYLLDRIIRAVYSAISFLRGSRATLVPLEGGVTKVTISKPYIRRWRPGSYVLLTIPKFGWLQAHPATIMSTPSSHNGDLVFILKGHKGFTSRLHSSADESTEKLLPPREQASDTEKGPVRAQYRATLSGPHGGLHEDFAAFDSVCLIAGSTGCTLTLALLQDVAQRAAQAHASGQKLSVRRLHFVWCVKQSSWASWANSEIDSAVEKLRRAGIETRVSVYVTCSDAFTEGGKETRCRCDKFAGPRCCVTVKDEDNTGKAGDDPAITVTMSVTPEISSSSAAAAGGSGSVSNKRPSPTKLSVLPCADFYSGRPIIHDVLADLLDGADGESGVAVCGPIGLQSAVRNNIVWLSDQRGIHKGTGAQGCYLHVESFS